MTEQKGKTRSMGSAEVEWNYDMGRDVLKLDVVDGPFNRATVKGRCKNCWGELLGRSNEEGVITGIKCLVCGTILEGNDAAEEKRRMDYKSTLNLLNMRHGHLPTYGDGRFVGKVFPHLPRLTNDELEERIRAKKAENRRGKSKRMLTRNDFPNGSPGALCFQAEVLMTGVEQTTDPGRRVIVDIPDFDVKDDGAVGVQLSREELGQGERQRYHTHMSRLGAFMIRSMNLAFACELAMKAIILTCKDEARKIHDLTDLFNDLPHASQARIKADYAEIEEVLEQGRKTFGAWRYFEVAVTGEAIEAMIRTDRAQALGKAARVILDEATYVGLRWKVNINNKANLHLEDGRWRDNYKVKFRFRGDESPPRE